MSEPLISIVIPVYNVEDYVEKCIRSVVAQTYTHLQILVIDDGSTDSSGAICDRLATTDSRIQVIHTANAGLSAARNVGIRHALGEYIAFVDSDDWIEPNMYEFLYKAIVKDNLDIAVASHYIDRGDKVIFRQKKNVRRTTILDRSGAIHLLMRDKVLHNYAWDKLYRRTLFEGLEYPEGWLYEDIAFTYRVVNRIDRMGIYPTPLYHYTVRPGSIVSGRYEIRRNAGYFRSEYEMMSHLYEQGYTEAARHLVRRGIHTIKRLIMSGAEDDMLMDILAKLRPYHVGIREIGLTNVWRRYMLEHHLQTYKRLYKLSKKLFGTRGR